MFKKIPYIRFIEGEDGQGVESGTADFTSGEPIQSTTENNSQQESSQQSSEGSQSSHNPNWDELKNELPDEFIWNKVRPHLERFDKNNNSRFEKVQQQFAPYQPLIENQVPFEQIQQAFQLRHELANNTRGMFERLGQTLGIDGSRLQKLFEAEQEQQESQGLRNGIPEGEEEALDPRIEQMKRQQDAMTAYLAQQWEQANQQQAAIQQQQNEQRWFSETTEVLDKFNVQDKEERNWAVNFAIMQAQQTGKPVDIEAGVRAMRAFQGQAIQNRRYAPPVSDGTGNFIADQVDFKQLASNRESLDDYVVQQLKKLNGGN